jgi:hypothetical protein
MQARLAQARIIGVAQHSLRRAAQQAQGVLAAIIGVAPFLAAKMKFGEAEIVGRAGVGGLGIEQKGVRADIVDLRGQPPQIGGLLGRTPLPHMTADFRQAVLQVAAAH